MLQPELFRQDPRLGLMADAAVEPQPSPCALAAELPARQDRFDGWGLLIPTVMFTDLVKEVEAKQHPRPCLGRSLWSRVLQTGEGEIREALG